MRRNRIKTGSITCGLLVIAAGVLLFAFNTGLLNPAYRCVVFSWPMLLVAMGFVFLFSRHKWFGGVVLILVGGLFLLPKLDIGLDFITQNGWAIALVVAGIMILCKTIGGRRNPEKLRAELERHREWHRERLSRKWKKYKHESGYVDCNCVFGGSKEKMDFKDFKGGEINSVFGGIELDLSEAHLVEGVHNLELNSVFGGIILYVPIEWNIELRQIQVFGQFVDKRPKPGFEVDEKSRLIIEANSVFGGGEIRCREK